METHDRKVLAAAGEALVSNKSCQAFLQPHRLLAHQAPLPVELSRQEYWSGLPLLLQWVFPTQGPNQRLLHLAGGFLTTELPGKQPGRAQAPNGKAFSCLNSQWGGRREGVGGRCMQIRGLQQGFLKASTTDGLGPDDFCCVVGCRPVPWRTATPPPRVTVKNACRHCQMSPGGWSAGLSQDCCWRPHTFPLLCSALSSAGVFMVLVGRWGRNCSRNRWEATGIQG